MRVVSAVIAAAEGVEMNVSQVCRDAGVSRKTFYAYLGRYRAEGMAGLEERSRRPLNSPGQCPAEIEERIVRLRKELSDAGLDHGATTIHWHLGSGSDSDSSDVPSIATVHRVLTRRGLVTAQPHKRPKTSWRRFEAPAPNEWWQIDHTDWVLATGVVIKIFNVIDDHSRVVVACRCVSEATGEQAWVTFCQAAQQWGLPAGVLSDNGLCFSGKLRGYEVMFESNLRDAGVRPITGRAYHPQTTGKVERFQQTLKAWLRRQPLAADLTQLQAQLDAFCRIYNDERPHQGIGSVTPLSRWQATPATPAANTPLEHPQHRRTTLQNATVTSGGQVAVTSLKIYVGTEWRGHNARILIDNDHATVFINGLLIRHLKLDRTRQYQRAGRPSRRHQPKT